MKTAGERLKLFINKTFKTKREFAKKIGMHENSIGKYAGDGEKSIYGKEYQEKLSILGLNIAWYLTGEGNIYNDNISYNELAQKFKNNRLVVSNFFIRLRENIVAKLGGIENMVSNYNFDKPRVDSFFETENIEDYYVLGYLGEAGIDYKEIFNSSLTEALTNKWKRYPVFTNKEIVSEIKQPFYKEVFDKLLNLPVYDLPAHALLGVGQSYEDLPMSFKQLNIGIKLDAGSVKLFRVSGDSMIDVHILSGAYIVVDTELKPVNGSKVLANHNGTLIVKFCEIINGQIEFYSMNGGKHPYQIYPDDYFSIIGVVRAVLNYM